MAVPFEVLDKIIYIPDTIDQPCLLSFTFKKLRLIKSFTRIPCLSFVTLSRVLACIFGFQNVDIIQITQTVELQIVFFSGAEIT